METVVLDFFPTYVSPFLYVASCPFTIPAAQLLPYILGVKLTFLHTFIVNQVLSYISPYLILPITPKYRYYFSFLFR